MKQIPVSPLYVKITYHATCMTHKFKCAEMMCAGIQSHDIPPPTTSLPPIQPLLHLFLQPDFPPPSPHIHTDWHFNYFVIHRRTPSSHPFPRPMHKIPRLVNLSTLVPLCIPASLLMQPLTSSLPSLSLLSKPILSLLHQLRWAEAHCAKCHLISLSLAAAVIERTFPLFLSSVATFLSSLYQLCCGEIIVIDNIIIIFPVLYLLFAFSPSSPLTELEKKLKYVLACLIYVYTSLC